MTASTGDRGQDAIDGGPGHHTIFGNLADDRSRAVQATIASTSAAAGATTCALLSGSRFDDLLAGGAGNDRIIGGAGADNIAGGTGLDEMWGGAGRDLVDVKDSARDVVSCGRGRDRVSLDRHDRVTGCEKPGHADAHDAADAPAGCATKPGRITLPRHGRKLAAPVEAASSTGR